MFTELLRKTSSCTAQVRVCALQFFHVFCSHLRNCSVLVEFFAVQCLTEKRPTPGLTFFAEQMIPPDLGVSGPRWSLQLILKFSARQL